MKMKQLAKKRKKEAEEKAIVELDLITLIEGDLDNIREKVRDETAELLQNFEQQHKQALVSFRRVVQAANPNYSIED